MREWRGGPKFWNFIEDNSKVLGQVLHMTDFSQYKAYDNTRLNKSGTTAMPIGEYATLELAQEAVEALFTGSAETQ